VVAQTKKAMQASSRPSTFIWLAVLIGLHADGFEAAGAPMDVAASFINTGTKYD
jgi:hypothetical protein